MSQILPFPAIDHLQRHRSVAVPGATGTVPIEGLVVPPLLNGTEGTNRGQGGVLAATDDHAAIDAWLASRRANPHTLRAYRSQAERLLLWALQEKRKALSSLTVEDCVDYRDFLAALDPQAALRWRWRLPLEHWVGPRSVRRWSPMWKPFAGPLSAESQNQARTVLLSLFEWLCRQGYLRSNPWDGVAERQRTACRIKSDHALSEAQWQAVMSHCDALPRDERYYRLRFVLWLAYGTGLRLMEMTRARLGHVQAGPPDPLGGAAWELAVIGKRSKRREVPLAPIVMDALQDYLGARGLGRDVAGLAAGVPLIAPLASDRTSLPGGARAMTEGGLYRLLKRHFTQVASAIAATQPEDAHRLRAASTHWLRHTHATHAVARGMPIDVLQTILGHESLATTTIYVTADRQRRQQAVREFVAAVVAGR